MSLHRNEHGDYNTRGASGLRYGITRAYSSSGQDGWHLHAEDNDGPEREVWFSEAGTAGEWVGMSYMGTYQTLRQIRELFT